MIFSTHVKNPNPQCDEAFEKYLGHEGRALSRGLVPL